ncbi:MAG: hypothetical protein LH616_09810 [Ilumatobacteraceae bacterium]|nr:hypothetical protein [Ilumatobacteraceae bacterium]
MVDVVGSESADSGGLLRVEHDEQPGDSVVEREGVVVEKPSGLVPSVFGVEHAGRALPGGGGKLEAGQLLSFRPANERSGAASLADGGGCHPFVEVELGAGRKGAVAGVEPVEEHRRRLDLAACGCCLVDGGGGVAGAVPKPAQDMPGRVSVQDLSVVRFSSSERLGDPRFELSEVLIAFRQGVGGHEHGAQVMKGFGGGELIERCVGERADAAGELFEHGDGGAVGEPSQRCGGPLDGDQGVVEIVQLGPDVVGAVGQQFLDAAAQLTAGAVSGDELAGIATRRACLPPGCVDAGAVGAQRFGPSARTHWGKG